MNSIFVCNNPLMQTVFFIFTDDSSMDGIRSSSYHQLFHQQWEENTQAREKKKSFTFFFLYFKKTGFTPQAKPKMWKEQKNKNGNHMKQGSIKSPRGWDDGHISSFNFNYHNVRIDSSCEVRGAIIAPKNIYRIGSKLF